MDNKTLPVGEYTIDCTGNACVGDDVIFLRAIFTGTWRKPVFVRNEIVQGVIIRDSYGADKQQHTFTLRLPDGQILRIKGRNLYRNGIYRRRWDDEALRTKSLNDKYRRGEAARFIRELRTRHQLQYGD